MNFEDSVVGITGYSSFNTDYHLAVAKIIELEGGKIAGDFGYDEEWEIEQLILVGDVDFDEEYLIESVEIGIQNKFTCQYISLEDFWEHYDDNYQLEPYSKDDPRVKKHAGLSFLASLGFKYPEIDIFSFGDRSQDKSKGWNPESILKSKFGYSVECGMSLPQRRSALVKAVNSPEIISLQKITEHIAFNINIRKKNKVMISAVERWQSDLAWLRKNYYDNSVHSFTFPQISK